MPRPIGFFLPGEAGARYAASRDVWEGALIGRATCAGVGEPWEMAAADHAGSHPPEGHVPGVRKQPLAQQRQIEFELEFFGQLLERDPTHADALWAHANNLAACGDYARALVFDRRLVRLRPERPSAWYNLACSLAVLGARVPALTALERALELGFRRRWLLAFDPDLSALRDNPQFCKLLRRFGLSIPL